MSTLPLARFKVLDLTRVRAGPTCVRQLADWGAEVIKIEAPEGDAGLGGARHGPDFWNLHRNKRSLTLDLKAAEGREIFYKLVAASDVVVENYRPDVKDRLKIDYATLAEINPRIVYASISGFGQDGPYRERPGFGTLVEGMSGFAAMNGFGDREPVLPPLALADMVAGLYGAFAVMIARREVEAGRPGQVIDLPLLDPMVSILGPQAAMFQVSGEIPPRTGSRSNTTSPRNVFRTRDGRYIAISASIQAMAERLLRTIGREDMISDPRFAHNTARVANAAECEAPIAAFIAARDSAEVLAIFEKAEITAAPVYDIDQLIDDPHVAEREILVELPDADLGHVAMHAVVPRLAATPGAIRSPAPGLGEHTAEVLRMLGRDEAAITALAASGAVKLG